MGERAVLIRVRPRDGARFPVPTLFVPQRSVAVGHAVERTTAGTATTRRRTS
jgi:hypothetical protein